LIIFKLYSKGCEYTIRALVQALVGNNDGNFSPSKICRKTKIPEPYTRKIFQALSKKGLLKATSGPGGGYSLIKHPKDISLLEIIKAVDGENIFNKCILGFAKCGGRNPCPIHKTWEIVKKTLIDQLSVKTLNDIIKIEKK
jgi:Rrf2 family protein